MCVTWEIASSSSSSELVGDSFITDPLEYSPSSVVTAVVTAVVACCGAFLSTMQLHVVCIAVAGYGLLVEAIPLPLLIT